MSLRTTSPAAGLAAGADLLRATPTLLVGLHLRHDRIQIERRRSLPRRELLELFDLRRHNRLSEVQLWDVVDQPVVVDIRVDIGPLERIASQVVDERQSEFDERLRPNGG